MIPTESYPLQWPVGRPRTPRHKVDRARFGKKVQHAQHSWKTYTPLSIYAATDRLMTELDRLGAKDIVVSSNLRPRRDGLPINKQREPDDHGVAVYFRLKEGPHVLACDKWDRVADNIAAVAAHVEAIRGQARWGVGDLAQAFAGYKALPAAEAKRPWWEVLALKTPPDSLEGAGAQYRMLMTKHHPDHGGSQAEAAEITAAWAEARTYYGDA